MKLVYCSPLSSFLIDNVVEKVNVFSVVVRVLFSVVLCLYQFFFPEPCKDTVHSSGLALLVGDCL